MIKAVFVDMDGTLLNNKKAVTEKTARAILKFQKKGGLFAINTGRDFVSASVPVKKAGIDCDYICLSGACIYRADGACVKSDVIGNEELKKIRALEKEYDLYGLYLSSGGKITSCTRDFSEKQYVNEERILAAERGEDPELVSAESFQMLLDDIMFEKDIDQLIEENLPIYKVTILGMNQEKLLRAKEEMKKWKYLKIASSAHTNVEINSDRVDKAISAAVYAEEKGISLSEIMVIGDSENDMAMLSYPFGKTVAMGNAEKSIQALCTNVTLSNEEDGVAYALEQWT